MIHSRLFDIQKRPDVAANHLLEGHVLVLVDTSPSAMITPTTYFHHLQHAEEFRQNPAVGTFFTLGTLFRCFILLVFTTVLVSVCI
ncbi:spore germination protein [Bacillus paranthracis]